MTGAEDASRSLIAGSKALPMATAKLGEAIFGDLPLCGCGALSGLEFARHAAFGRLSVGQRQLAAVFIDAVRKLGNGPAPVFAEQACDGLHLLFDWAVF